MSEGTQYTLYSNRDLFNLIGPLIMERDLVLTVGVADGMMVAYLGEASVSAVSMVNLLNVFLHNIFLAISVGGVVTASQCLGAKDRPQALYHLAVCFRKKGRPDMAAEQLDLAREIVTEMGPEKLQILY